MSYLVIDIETIPLPGIEPPKFEAPSNYKDPVKIAAYCAEKQREWLEGAALHAERARVALVGVFDGKTAKFYDTASEDLLIDSLWQFCVEKRDAFFVGHCITHFDIPFLMRRSMLLGIKYPTWFWGGRYLSDRFIDTMTIWQCSDRQARISLDTLARACGLPGKNGNGAEFGRLWIEDRPKAIAYCEHDLRLTWQVAEHIGAIQYRNPNEHP